MTTHSPDLPHPLAAKDAAENTLERTLEGGLAAENATEAPSEAAAETDEAADATARARLIAAQDETFKKLGPLLAISLMACDFLWHLAHKQPILDELKRRTGLNPSVLARLQEVKTGADLANLWDDGLPRYYYALLVGRLVLESPLRPLFRTLLSTSPDAAGQLDNLADRAVHFTRGTAPITERWLIGERGAAGPDDPLPEDPAKRAELAGWVARRADLEAYFQRAAPELERAGIQLLKSLPPDLLPALRPAPAPVPEPRGPFLRRTFVDAELAALRLLLTYVPTLTTLLPGQPFAQAMHALSALQPPTRVADLLQRLRVIKPGQALHFSLADCLTLLQTLQSGALLLLRASSGELVRTLRRHADDPDDPDEDLRIERGRLLFLLADDTTRTQFRATFGPLLKSFTAAVDRTYPYAPELTKARAELADLAAVR